MPISTLATVDELLRVSVIIPTGRGGEPLRRALRSCVRQELEGHGLEIIVVANPPSPGVETLVEEIRDEAPGVPVQVLQLERRGANLARNRGLGEATGDILFFLDDDCELPDEDHLRQRIELHREDPRLGGLGGPYRSPRGGTGTCEFYNSLQELWLEANRDRQGDPLVLLGGNASYRRDVFEACGGFDESLVYGGTETEFNHRLVLAERRIGYRSGLAVLHHFEGSWGSLLRRAWRQGRGKGVNPHQSRIDRVKDPTARRQALSRRVGSRWAFLPLFLVYRLVVELGRRLARR